MSYKKVVVISLYFPLVEAWRDRHMAIKKEKLKSYMSNKYFTYKTLKTSTWIYVFWISIFEISSSQYFKGHQYLIFQNFIQIQQA